MRRALLLDLDDTLYDEAHYVQSGFRHVAEIASMTYGVDAQAALAFLEQRLRVAGRGRLFDDLLERNGLVADDVSVGVLVEAYRTHRPLIDLPAEVGNTLRQLRAGYLLAIVTDGLPAMQRRKVEALRLEEIVDTVVYCWEHDCQKPSPVGHRIALERLGGAVPAAVVGDNVSHDLPVAIALEVPFIRILRGRFADVVSPAAPIPVVELREFRSVPEVLRALESFPSDRISWPPFQAKVTRRNKPPRRDAQ